VKTQDHMNTNQDNLNFTEIAKSFLLYRNWILIATVIAFVIAWIVSSFFLPKRYRGEAIIFMTPAGLSDGMDPSKIVLNLASMDEIIPLIKGDKIVSELNIDSDENILLEYRKKSGSSVILDVTANDPQRVVEIANLWAEKILADLQGRYGVATVFAEIEEVLQDNSQIYGEIELSFPVSLLDWHEAILEANLEQARRSLVLDLSKIDHFEALWDDIQSFDQQLEQNADNIISEEQRIILETLLQHVFLGLEMNQGIYIFQDAPIEGESIEQTRASLRELELIVQEAIMAAEYRVVIHQATIVKLAIQIDAINGGHVVQITQKAQLPKKPEGLSPWINASLASFLTLMLSGLVAVFLGWWRASDGRV